MYHTSPLFMRKFTNTIFVFGAYLSKNFRYSYCCITIVNPIHRQCFDFKGRVDGLCYALIDESGVRQEGTLIYNGIVIRNYTTFNLKLQYQQKIYLYIICKDRKYF